MFSGFFLQGYVEQIITDFIFDFGVEEGGKYTLKKGELYLKPVFNYRLAVTMGNFVGTPHDKHPLWANMHQNQLHKLITSGF